MKYTKLIHNFLEGKLNNKELRKFAKLCRENADFRKRVFSIIEANDFLTDYIENISGDIDAGISVPVKDEEIEEAIKLFNNKPIQSGDERKLIETIALVSKRKQKSLSANNGIRKFKYWIAASIIILITLPLGVVKLTHKENNDSIYENYFRVCEPLTFRGSGDIYDSLYTHGVLFFRKGDYFQAIKTFELIPYDQFNFSLVRLYEGNAYMKERDFIKAKEIFHKILDQDCLIIGQAAWYLALTEMKLSNYQEAIEYLDMAINMDYNTKESKHLRKILYRKKFCKTSDKNSIER